jgi:hypothetical protein
MDIADNVFISLIIVGIALFLAWLAFKIVAMAFGWIVATNAHTHRAGRHGSAGGNAGEKKQSGER